MDTIEAALKDANLNTQRTPVVEYLVRRIAFHGGKSPKSDPNSERSSEVYAIGEALNALGESDEDGFFYMQVACECVETIFGWRPYWLNNEWDRIGRWMA